MPQPPCHWSRQWLPLEWLIQPPAPDPNADADAASGSGAGGGIRGDSPLPWWAAGLYDGQLRRELLSQRRQLRPDRLEPRVRELAAGLRRDTRLNTSRGVPLLVPVPSWKSRPNPLPLALARLLSAQLDWPVTPLLRRSRPVLGQHRLGRALRWDNQQDAFRCDLRALADPRGRRPVVLLDDILTTGATACSAAGSLREAGWRLAGLACLARTPPRRGL